MKESRKMLLQKIYDCDRSTGNNLQISADGSDLGCNASELRNDVEFLKRNDYVVEPMHIMRQYVLTLTEKGEQFVENGFQSPSRSPASASFHFNGPVTNSVVGNDISGNEFTFTSGASLAEIESIIRTKPAEDQVVLNEMLEVLREIQSSEEPVDKGRLSRFYEIIKNSSDLLLPIGKFFCDIFFHL